MGVVHAQIGSILDGAVEEQGRSLKNCAGLDFLNKRKMASLYDPSLYEALRTFDWTRGMQLAAANIGLQFKHLEWSPLHVA